MLLLLHRVPFFGYILPNLAAIKRSKNYMRKCWSALALEMFLKLTPSPFLHLFVALFPPSVSHSQNLCWSVLQPLCLSLCYVTKGLIILTNFYCSNGSHHNDTQCLWLYMLTVAFLCKKSLVVKIKQIYYFGAIEFFFKHGVDCRAA
jgi:hypothetical protein